MSRMEWWGGVGHSRRLCDDNLLQHSACSHMYSWNVTHDKQQIELHTNKHRHARACVRTQPHKHTEGDARLLTDKINGKLLFMYKRMTPKNVPWHRNTEISSVCHKKSQFIQFVLLFSAFTPFQLLSNYLQAAVFNIDSVVSEQDFDQSLWKHLMKQAKQV